MNKLFLGLTILIYSTNILSMETPPSKEVLKRIRCSRFHIFDLVESGNAEAVDKYLTENPGSINFRDVFTGSTLLHKAITNLEIVRVLLKHGAGEFINAVDQAGNTPLNYATDWMFSFMGGSLRRRTISFEEQNLEIARILVEDYRARVDVANNKGDTPLHNASQY